MNEHSSIEKKLTRSFFKTASITTAAALLGLITLIVISNRYSYALRNFGFAQGDIGKALFEFADSRSSLRATIGYDDADAIATVVKQHSENKVLFEEYFAAIENTIVSADGRKTYDEISAELDAYWALDQQVMDLGATTDRELCRQAQDIAIEELAPAYSSIYSKLESLLNVRVTVRGMRDQMAETLTSIGEVSSQVSSGSGDLADASQVLAEGATEQTNAVMELHATISEITDTMEKSAQSADESYMKARLYADKADNSREEMNAMMAAMERINASSNRIGDIISEIESIASQTNLLSLNASIEAARAGESGRGFAVVASQIRTLANQSAQAVVDTKELIEGSIREVSEGNRAAKSAAAAISSVVDGIKQIADFSKNLKIMVNGQTEAMREVEKGINQISEVVQSNAATAQEASATSQELSAQATILNGLIERFSLKG